MGFGGNVFVRGVLGMFDVDYTLVVGLVLLVYWFWSIRGVWERLKPSFLDS